MKRASKAAAILAKNSLIRASIVTTLPFTSSTFCVASVLTTLPTAVATDLAVTALIEGYWNSVLKSLTVSESPVK